MNSSINKILVTDWMWHLSRVLITFMFWITGIRFILNFHGAVMLVTSFGLHPIIPIALLTLVTVLVGSFFILIDRYVWLGSGILGVFTFLTILLVHDFWNLKGLDAQLALAEAESHITIIGALITVAILSSLRLKMKGRS